VSITISEIGSPIGSILLVERDRRVAGVLFADCFARYGVALEARLDEPRRAWREATRATPAARRLRDYFAGELAALDDLGIETGGTPFQRSVWEAVRRVSPGATATYGEIANAICAPAAVRAVGAANGANPVCLVVPCHRIIGANGDLTGYGGGMHRKRWLLAHESKQPALSRAAGL
jgi:methylated-DNA-[protein]-cysteine S-methyltransferase